MATSEIKKTFSSADQKDSMGPKSDVEAGDIIAMGVMDGAVYTDDQYKKLKRKIDRYLLPLIWLCYGIQQTDKTVLGLQAIFGLRQDTGLVGQQYSWLTTISYLCYLVCEFPSNFILQRWPLGRCLSVYMILWGIVVLCIGFAQNFTYLMVLRGLQGALECCISPGFILLVGSWYTTREHPSRMLVFQSANAGFGIFSALALYGIGTIKTEGFQTWRAMSYFLGGLTIMIGCTCMLLLGTPSEVRRLSAEEKQMATTRTLKNNSGDDQTGSKRWDWGQVVECLKDPAFYLSAINAFVSSVPNGGLTTFGGIIEVSFGFTNLQIILLALPRYVVSVSIFIGVGIVVSKWKNLRMYFMLAGIVPAFTGFMMMALIPTTAYNRWIKWGGYFLTTPYVLPIFLAWSFISSNVSGRTKKTVLASFTFIGICAGNMAGSQIFYDADAPHYIHGIIGCATCFVIDAIVIILWRLLYVWRNRRNDKFVREEGISSEDRALRAQEYGKQDKTDLQNPYFTYSL
ncbi:hypothetical protein G7054_g8314 [Neopestalotiopsis clavispora]|nr:hypothetical protein G7054_g8314 [Neopestalotiopsis clavispora]